MPNTYKNFRICSANDSYSKIHIGDEQFVLKSDNEIKYTDVEVIITVVQGIMIEITTSTDVYIQLLDLTIVTSSDSYSAFNSDYMTLTKNVSANTTTQIFTFEDGASIDYCDFTFTFTNANGTDTIYIEG